MTSKTFPVALLAALALAGCGKQAAEDAATNGTAAVTAEEYSVNDVTAIDAVTGQAANMAADVQWNDGDSLDNGEDSSAETDNSSAPKKPTKTTRPAVKRTEPAPATEGSTPEGNSAT